MGEKRKAGERVPTGVQVLGKAGGCPAGKIVKGDHEQNGERSKSIQRFDSPAVDGHGPSFPELTRDYGVAAVRCEMAGRRNLIDPRRRQASRMGSKTRPRRLSARVQSKDRTGCPPKLFLKLLIPARSGAASSPKRPPQL